MFNFRFFNPNSNVQTSACNAGFDLGCNQGLEPRLEPGLNPSWNPRLETRLERSNSGLDLGAQVGTFKPRFGTQVLTWVVTNQGPGTILLLQRNRNVPTASVEKNTFFFTLLDRVNNKPGSFITVMQVCMHGLQFSNKRRRFVHMSTSLYGTKQLCFA